MSEYGIISLNIYEKDNNWGSVLQSYALQEILKSLNTDVKVVDICPKFVNKYEAQFPIVRALPCNIKVLFYSRRNSILNAGTYYRRGKNFKQFINKYYNKTDAMTSKDLENQSFDGFIVGSDIVWNIDFTQGFDDLYFCNIEFMKTKRNIAYAPSMCDRLLSKQEEEIFRERLNNFSSISVREKSLVNYVSQFTNKKVASVLDPTLLLSNNHYKQFLLPRLVKEKYILVYTVPSDEPLAIYASMYAKKHGLKLVRIECLDIQKKSYDCISYNDAGIEEWLTLIKDAEIVITNSFHACIFSILFKTQFHAIYRNPGKTKIENLCKELRIENYSEKMDNYNFDIEREINYLSVYNELENKRSESINYLREALNKVDD